MSTSGSRPSENVAQPCAVLWRGFLRTAAWHPVFVIAEMHRPAPWDFRDHLARLLSPTAYPHAVSQVKLVETGIAWVLLTGVLAYKIKWPVKPGWPKSYWLHFGRAASIAA